MVNFSDGTSYAFSALTLEDTEDPKIGDLGDELRQFEHILRFRPFVVRTDSGALKHLHNLKDPKGIMARAPEQHPHSHVESLQIHQQNSNCL